MKLPSRKYEEVVISIDAILDTRLGTLAKLDPKLAEDALLNNYHKRYFDKFGDMSVKEFRELYVKRDKEVLKRSRLTAMGPFVMQLCNKMAIEASQNPKSPYPEVVVNCYPYDLTEEEKEHIALAVNIQIGEDVPVSVVTEPWTYFSPSYCRDHVAVLILYDYEPEWIDVNAKNFEKCGCPQVTLFGPAIYFEKEHTDKEIQEMTDAAMLPFQAVEFHLEPLVGLRLIDSRFFSVLT